MSTKPIVEKPQENTKIENLKDPANNKTCTPY